MCRIFLLILIALVFVGEFTRVLLMQVVAVSGAWLLFAVFIVYCFSPLALLQHYGIAKVLNGIELTLFVILLFLLTVCGYVFTVSALIVAFIVLFHLSTEKVDKVFKSHD